jgi:D-tyrosyl-tRNA(Tyr) deacylase
MIALLQRVTHAGVEINRQSVASIQQGLLVLVAIQSGDTQQNIQRMATRIINYRVFADETGKMNLNLKQINGGLILVPQFTLAANTKSGNRPSFSSAAEPELSKVQFEEFFVHVKQEYSKVQQGVFGADMLVSLTNDGPVTFWLET